MFHTWETSQFSNNENNNSSTSPTNKRRVSTTRACDNCRKRKIRCEIPRPGEPCEPCIWYRKGHTCHFTEPRQRQTPLKRSVEKTSVTLQEYRDILSELYPYVELQRLKGLNREELLDLCVKSSPSARPKSPISPDQDSRAPTRSVDAANLEQLQPIPDESTEGSESASSALQGITDDVNALSLSVKRSTSYLGISSVTAVLRVILWLDPEAQTYFSKTTDASTLPSRASSSPRGQTVLPASISNFTDTAPSPWEEIPLIRAYFGYVHPFAPLLDEKEFQKQYLSQSRHDSRWLLLLNTVLALGSIASAPNCEDHTHLIYWRRAEQHLDLQTLGSAHLETVQALALLAGLYLHYLQEPNQANALMGATLRLATTLGLHRDFSEGVSSVKTERVAYSIDLRRRVWWSIFILDAWVGYSLGRPSMGRISHAMTALVPQSLPQLSSLFKENVDFCTISTRMEDSLACSPIIADDERKTLDLSFVEWFNQSSVHSDTPRPGTSLDTHGVSVLKNVMRWRYLLCRSYVHRPVLLWCAMRRLKLENIPSEKRSSVETCIEVTGALINDISLTWQLQRPCQIAGWNATWLLYQGLMVPLLLLYSTLLDSTLESSCCDLVETGLTTLEALRDWSQTAVRSHDVVGRIYRTSRRHTNTEGKANTLSPQQDMYIGLQYSEKHPTTNEPFFGYDNLPAESRDTMIDTMFDSLNWSTNWQDPFSPTLYDQPQDALPGYDMSTQGHPSETKLTPFATYASLQNQYASHDQHFSASSSTQQYHHSGQGS